MTLIARGWSADHGGPRDVLGPGKIPWAGGPEIWQGDTGRWLWTAIARWITPEGVDDLARLRAEGWMVRLRPAGNAIRVYIFEDEGPQP